MSKRFLAPALLFVLGFIQNVQLLANTGPVSSQSAKAVLYWNEIAYNAFGGVKYQHSLMASRINAMVHLAIHDALNGIEEKYERYALKKRDSKADPFAAAASAAHAVLLNETPDQKAYLDSVLAVTLKSINDGDAKVRGIKLGIAAAKAVIEKRTNDGSIGNVMEEVAPSKIAGVYQAVPPFNFAFAPHWKNMQPFALKATDQFRSAPYPSLSSDEYAKAFNEVKEMGKLSSYTRTKDQGAYAKFWYEFSEAGWNRVARTAAVSQNMNMLEAARLLALVDMAIADAYIAGWDSKFHYNFWRPYTAIRNAATDGNNATAGDTSWQSSETSPPIHDYPSTHSALGNAAAKVLSLVVGEKVGFSMSSPTAVPAGAVRNFTSFTQAADENASSRVMAGIHFRFSCDAGQKMGNEIGEWTVKNSLRPLK